jgi:hypothetical protein
MSPIVAFYTGAGPDHRGRFLREILEWPDQRLEAVHDFIQWLFPLPDRSPVNPHAPLIDRETTEAFATRPELRDALRTSFERMLRFYGFAPGPGHTIARAPHFATSAENWLWPGNHNHLRITRILKCLTILGLKAEASALEGALEAVYEEHRARITPATVRFWREALTGHL